MMVILRYPLVICNRKSELENGPVEIVSFPMKNGGSFLTNPYPLGPLFILNF